MEARADQAAGLPASIVPFRASRARPASIVSIPAAEGTAWEVIRDRLADRWPILTLDELNATAGRPELVVPLLQAKLTYAQRLVAESLGPIPPRTNRRRRLNGRAWLSTVGLLGLSGFAFLGLVSHA